MEFKFYDPKRLKRELKKREIKSPFYKVCQGCVFTGIAPEDCFHYYTGFRTPSTQSDVFCDHCCDVLEEDEESEPFHLHEDRDLTRKIAELEKILEMVSQ